MKFNSKFPHDLPKRAHITTYREGEIFVTVLTVLKAKRSDSGLYVCHPVGVDPVDLKTQSETFPSVHIFISCILFLFSSYVYPISNEKKKQLTRKVNLGEL
jgi:hypothetical protein